MEKGEDEYIRFWSRSDGGDNPGDLGMFTGWAVNGLGVLWEIVRMGVRLDDDDADAAD